MRRKNGSWTVLAVAVMAAAVAKAWFVEPIARIEPLKEVTDLSEEWIVKVEVSRVRGNGVSLPDSEG